MIRDGSMVKLAVGLACAALTGVGQAREKDTKEPVIPTCDAKIGTLAVTEPENKWWIALQPGVARGADQGVRVAVQVLHAAGSRQGPGGRPAGARTGRFR